MSTFSKNSAGKKSGSIPGFAYNRKAKRVIPQGNKNQNPKVPKIPKGKPDAIKYPQ